MELLNRKYSKKISTLKQINANISFSFRLFFCVCVCVNSVCLLHVKFASFSIVKKLTNYNTVYQHLNHLPFILSIFLISICFIFSVVKLEFCRRIREYFAILFLVIQSSLHVFLYVCFCFSSFL